MSQALLFPGQGSQFVGMGKDLCDRYPAAREVFARADAALGLPLTRLIFEGPEETLRETRNAQPALLTHSLAVWAAMEARWDPGNSWLRATASGSTAPTRWPMRSPSRTRCGLSGAAASSCSRPGSEPPGRWPP